MSDPFKESLYRTCSPTLQGVKPSSLFTLHKEKCPRWAQDLAECRSTLHKHGYGILVLEENERFLVVMVYHPRMLRRCLSESRMCRCLQSMGYRSGLSLEAKLDLLGKRFRCGSFPHEIGLFLGYPIDDVTGFIANHGENCKLAGEWKVYGDVKRAIQLFHVYQDSRRTVFDQARRGMELDDILRTC